RGMVPVTVEALDASSGTDGVLLQWRLSAAATTTLLGVRVERADAAAGPYRTVAPARAPERDMPFRDASAEPGRPDWYRLVLAPPRGAEFIAGPLQVSTDAGAPRTRLDTVAESADGSVQFRYRIGAAGPVRLELFDVVGRRLRIVDAGMRGTGSHLAS